MAKQGDSLNISTLETKPEPTQIKWSSQVDNFGEMKPQAQACLANVKTHQGARDALYEGTNDPLDDNSKVARVAFLNYLQDELMPAMKRLEPANEKGIELKAFLDTKGYEFYKAAVNEEVRSQAFRDAVFQKSTNHYGGPTWSQRLIAPFAGPSAAGKSVTQPKLIAKIAELMPKSNRNDGNDIVSVDGGVEREVSQIRGIVLQVALAKGFNGINDLDKKENKADVPLKKIVEKTVLATPGLNMVIPKTYTSEALNFVSGSVGKDEFKKYDKVDDGNAILAFGIVEAEHGNVVKNGTSRARNATEFTEQEIGMNVKPPCESKDYHDHYKEGTYLSTAAKENYLALDQADNKPRICVTVTSDFTFIKPDPKSPGGWALAGKDEEWNKDMVGMLERDFERYQAYSQQNLQQISSKLNTLKTTAENLKMFMNQLTVELSTIEVNSPESVAKQKTLDNIKKQSDDVVAKLSDAIKEVRSAKNTDVKAWLEDNGWSPPVVEVKSKESKLNIRKKSFSVQSQTVQPSSSRAAEQVQLAAAASKSERKNKRNKKTRKVAKIGVGVTALTAATVLTGGAAAGVALGVVAYQRRKKAKAIRKIAQTDANVNVESVQENNVNPVGSPLNQNHQRFQEPKGKKPEDAPKTQTYPVKIAYKPLDDIEPSNQETNPKNDIVPELNDQPIFIPKNSLLVQLLNEFVQVRNLDQLDKLMDLANHQSNRGHVNTVWKFQDSELKTAESLLYKAITVARSEKNVLVELKIQVLLSDVQKRQLTVASSIDANVKIDPLSNRSMDIFTQAFQILNKPNNPLGLANSNNSTRSASPNSPYITNSTNPLLFSSFSNKTPLLPAKKQEDPPSHKTSNNSYKHR